MPNSAEINPGDDLLSAQYNALRNDVLNVASGHGHSGAPWDGVRINYADPDETETISGKWTFENPLFTQYLKHAGDLDTFINFQDNNFQVDVGGKTALFLDDLDDNVLLGADAGAALDASGANTLLGYRTGAAATDASSSVGIGADALRLGNASHCVAIGYEALENAGTTKAAPSDGDDNTAVGTSALSDMDAGKGNIAVGYGAMWAMEDGDYNIGIGYNAMQYGAGNRNIAIGFAPMGNATTASAEENIGIGTNALYVLTDGCNNIGIGAEALMYVGAGNNNIGIGYEAGYGHGSSGWNNNVFIGYQAGLNIESGGDDNVIIGFQAGLTLTIGVDNVFIGRETGYTCADEGDNVAIGVNAMRLATASSNVAIGRQALENAGTTSAGDANVAVGHEAMRDMDTGTDNVAIGASAMVQLTLGSCNVAVGEEAMKGIGAGGGSYNIAIGYYSGVNLTTGSEKNVIVGAFAAGNLTTGDYNIVIGEAMGNNQTANNNIVIGFEAGKGSFPTTYDDCVIIGHQAGYLLESGNANVFIGYQAGYNETGSNKLYIENSNSAEPLIYGEFDNNLIKVYGTVESTVGFIVEQISTPTYKYLQDWMNTTQSAGLISGGTISATSYAIDTADDVAETFTIVGDVSTYFTNGVVFTVSGSTGNDGDYTTVGNAIFGGGVTTITVADVPDGTDDGDIADGRVDVAAGTGMVKKTDDEIDGVTAFLDWTGTTHILLVDNDVNWLYVKYNGSTTVNATNDATTIDHTTEFTIGRVYREGTVVHVLQAGQYIYDPTFRAQYRACTLRAVERARGAIISDEGTLKIKVTAATLFCGWNEITTAEVDTSGAGRFRAWHHDGGGNWTSTGYPADQTDIDSANYDTGTGLAALNANRYGVYWVFLDFDSHVQVVYGRASYKLHEAQAAALPAIPDICSEFAVLVARVIAFKDAPEITEVQSAFVVVFAVATAMDHGDLGNVTANQHHNEVHVVNSTGPHAEGGLTIGHVLRASGAAAFAFAELQHDDLGGVGIDDHHGEDHVLLSAPHTDTVADGVVAGDVIIGNDTPKWERLAIAVPAANVRNVLGIDNGETVPSWKTALDNVDPEDIGVVADPGTSLFFSHRDHVHAFAGGAPVHVVNSTGPHAEGGLTVGHVLRASGAAAFAFAELQHDDLGGVGADDHHDVVTSGALISVTDQVVSLAVGTAQWQVPLTGADPFTPAWIAASEDVSAGAEAILKSNAAGDLALHDLTVLAQSLWGDGSDGAIANLVDADTDATTIAQIDPVTLTHNRTVRATGNITLSEAITVSKQNGMTRASTGFPTTHGGPGISLGAIMAAVGSKGTPPPVRPGGETAALCGGVMQLLSGGTVAIGGTITAQGANAASDGGGGGGLVVVVAKTAISGASAIDVSAASAHATPAARAGSGSYSGEPGGHAGIGGCGGGGASTGKYVGGLGGAGYIAGQRGGDRTGGWHGLGGGGLEAHGGDGDQGSGGGDGVIASARWNLKVAGLLETPTPGAAGSLGTYAAGADGGGGGGGPGNHGGDKHGGNGGDNGSGGGGGGAANAGQGNGGAGGNGANGGVGCFALSSHSVYAGCPGGQGGGGGGAGGGSVPATGGAGGTAGTGASGAVPVSAEGAGSGGVGANGTNGTAGSSGASTAGDPGAGGSGGNGGGAAGLVLLIAPTITYSGTVTGRLVKIDGADALDFIRRYYVD